MSPPDPDADATPAVYDHVRAPERPDAPVDLGVYRVVGAGDPVALLRVGDADGRRVNTGAVVAVSRDALVDFHPADNPDGNRSVGAAVAGALDTLGWQLQSVAGGLRARPLASMGALALVVAGHQGDRFIDAPDPAFTAVYVAGVLALVLVGTRGG